MPTIINFTAVTKVQIRDSLLVFDGYKDCDLTTLSVSRDADSVFQDDLPPPKDICGAIVHWGSPNLAIVIAILNLRSRSGLADFKLFTMTDGVVRSFRLEPRYTIFYRPETEEDGGGRHYLIGQQSPRAEARLSRQDSPVIIHWYEPGPADWRSYETYLTDCKGPVVIDFRGGWWAFLEHFEKLTPSTRPSSM